MSPRSWKIAPIVLALFLSPVVHRAGAQAVVCKDGTTSATAGRGACSHHGGVAPAKTAEARKDARAERKTDRQAAKTEQKAESQTAKAERKSDRAAATSERRTDRQESRADAEVTCTDGSMSKPGRGACARHGGIRVAGSMAPSPRRPMTATRSGSADDNNPVGAIAQCKDGLYSHAANRRGACSRHHGVARWL